MSVCSRPCGCERTGRPRCPGPRVPPSPHIPRPLHCSPCSPGSRALHTGARGRMHTSMHAHVRTRARTHRCAHAHTDARTHTQMRARTHRCARTHRSMPSPSPHPGGSRCIPILQTRQRGGALCSHHAAPLGTWRAVRVLFCAGCSGLPWRGLQGLVPRSLAEWGASQPTELPASLFPWVQGSSGQVLIQHLSPPDP